ncbi:MAG: hypothetical protein ACLFWL_18300 [Candidatus Brocadiia bacterium]
MCPSSAGGAATQTGILFQNRIAAWAAVHILAEESVSIPWDLRASTTLESLRCETEHPVDDLLIRTSEDGNIYVQAKHSINLGRKETYRAM